MHFANPIAIIVTSPFLDGMTDSGMGSLELVIALRFIGVDLSGGLGELMNMPTKSGTRRIADDAQPHLPTLSPNRPEFLLTVGFRSPLERFFRLSLVVLLTLRADCSLFALKAAHSSP